VTLKETSEQHSLASAGECFLPRPLADPLSSTSRRMEPLVDIALKLNVVVVCAVFLFVGAILIGAF
jgi:hypothetical protein